MTTNRKLILGAILAAAFLPAHANEADNQPVTRTIERRVVQGGPGAMVMHGDFMGAMPRMGGKIVKNAPYSAEMLMEKQQNLADGNQIAKSTSSMSYRDSAGRTRHEMRDATGEVRAVTINDPAERITWILRPQDKTATKVNRVELARAGAEAAEAGRAAAAEARARIEELRKEGKLPFVARRAGADGQQIVIREFRRAEPGKNGADGDVRMHIGQVLASAFGDAKWSANATTKDLGTREFDGVKAQGKQRSYEIPAGAIGNRNPIVVTSESWYSPELQVTVYSKHSDPRSGDTVYRMQNLKREEPPAALFTVPSDYTVKDVAATIRRKKEERNQ